MARETAHHREEGGGGGSGRRNGLGGPEFRHDLVPDGDLDARLRLPLHLVDSRSARSAARDLRRITMTIA